MAKKLLLHTTTYLDLHKPIVAEFEKRGWEITTVIDRLLEGDEKLRSTPLRDFAKKFIQLPKHRSWPKRAMQFWDEKLPALDTHYDLFLCLNAFTIPAKAVRTIKERTDRTVLYAWDCSAIWDFSVIAPYFDAAFTFDLADSMKSKHLNLLPNYFQPSEHDVPSTPKYSAVMLGANRAQRLNFIYALAAELRRHGLGNYYLKLMPHELPPLSQRIFKDYRLTKKLNSGQLEEFTLHNPVSADDYQQMMRESAIVIDDVMPRQSGLTPRFMWALANNKKIITTNKWAHHYSFVNPADVLIVDRKHPAIPAEFLSSEVAPVSKTLEVASLPRWVDIIAGDARLPGLIR